MTSRAVLPEEVLATTPQKNAKARDDEGPGPFYVARCESLLPWKCWEIKAMNGVDVPVLSSGSVGGRQLRRFRRKEAVILAKAMNAAFTMGKLSLLGHFSQQPTQTSPRAGTSDNYI